MAIALLLGALQGLTEFLPISSDGHLVVASFFLPVSLSGADALGFDVLLHGGSLLALLWVYRGRWIDMALSIVREDRENRFLLFLLIVGTLPGIAAGLLFADFVSQSRSLMAAGTGFLITAAVLLIGESCARTSPSGKRFAALHALLIGCAQAIAILPGVSRSGLTTIAGRALGFSRRDALDFSFLLAVPIICGAVAKTLWDGSRGTIAFPTLSISLVGIISSFVVSVMAIAFLRRFVGRWSLAWFTLYLLPLGSYLLFQELGLKDAISAEHIPELLRTYGAIALFFLALFECIPPASFFSPAVFSLVIAGSLVNHPLPGILFFGAGVIGTVIGNVTLFCLGRTYGRTLAHHLYLSEKRLSAVDLFMDKYGRVSVLCGQFLGFLRPALAFVAGTSKMATRTYLLSMLPASILWAGGYLTLGFFLKRHLPWLIGILGSGGVLLLLIVAIALIANSFALRRKAARAKGSGE